MVSKWPVPNTEVINTHMSYKSLPAEAVLSELRSMMYISYCNNRHILMIRVHLKWTTYNIAWGKEYVGCMYVYVNVVSTRHTFWWMIPVWWSLQDKGSWPLWAMIWPHRDLRRQALGLFSLKTRSLFAQTLWMSFLFNVPGHNPTTSTV